MSDDPAEQFLRFMETERSASPRTLANYRHALNCYRNDRGDAFSGWRDQTADDFRLWLFALMKRGLGRATIRLRFAALRSFYKYLVLRRGLPKSPLAGVELPKAEKTLPVVLSVRQIEELLELPLATPVAKNSPAWTAPRDAAILELFYSCGLRTAYQNAHPRAGKPADGKPADPT